MNIAKNQITEKIINILLNFFIAILSVILLVTTYTGVQIKLLKQDHSNFFGYTMFEVQTNSMKDTIKAGDWIIVKLDSKINLDDIITYKQGKNFITHRVVEIHDKKYSTQGDNNVSKDAKLVEENQVVGKVVNTLAGFGILRKTILNPAVLVFLIISLFLLESIIKDKNNKETKTNIVLKKIIKFIKEKIKYINRDKKISSLKKEMILQNIIKEDNDKLIITDELEKIVITEEEPLIVVEDETEEEPLIVVENETEEEPLVVEEINDESFIISTGNTKEENEITEVKLEDQKHLDEELEDEEILDDDEYYDSDLDKTQFFRIIPVDTSQIDETMLEIAKYEMADTEKEKKKEISKIEVEKEVVNDSDDLTDINLDILKKSVRRNKNTIDALMNIKTDELNELVSLVQDDEKLDTNEPTIRNSFNTVYIHAKYYNYFSEKEINYKGKNFLVKVSKLFEIVGKELKDTYKGTDNKYNEKVDKFVKIFNIIAALDQGASSIEDLKTKREFFKSELAKYQTKLDTNNLMVIANEVISLQKTYEEISRFFLKKLESNTFRINMAEIVKDSYAVNLIHNVDFNRIYSEHVIEQTYEEGIIAEDKMPVKITLLLAKLLDDMINCNFQNKYYITLPESLYSKEKKIFRIVKTYDDEYAKSHIIILIDFDVLVKNKKIVKKLRKAGYKFAVGFPDTKNLPAKEKSSLYMANLIFVNKKDPNYNKLDKFIPNDLKSYIINDDVYEKFESLEGED